MSLDPQKPIVNQIRAWARARRTQAPKSFSLDAERRRRLHAELDRVFPKAFAAPSWVRMFLDAWPRFAIPTYAAIAISTVIAVVLLIPRMQRVEIALNKASDLNPPPASARMSENLRVGVEEASSASATTLSLAPEPNTNAVAKADSTDRLLTLSAEPASLPPIATTASAVAPTRLAQAAPRPTPAPQADEPPPTAIASRALVQPETIPASPPPATESVRFVFSRDQSAGRREEQGQPPAAAPILTTFEIRAEGNIVHIRDADGSLYDGSIENLRADEVNRSTLGAGFRFNARGTNRTINQVVTLSGQLEPLIAAATIPSAGPAAPRTFANAAPAAAPGGGGGGRGGAGGRGGGRAGGGLAAAAQIGRAHV